MLYIYIYIYVAEVPQPPKKLNFGFPERQRPPTPEAMLTVGQQSGIEDVFRLRCVPLPTLHYGGAGSEMDDAKKPEVKFLGGW